MAVAEFRHFVRLRDRLVDIGSDPEVAMYPFRAGIDGFHDSTAPADWLEGLVKAYVGDGIGADFYREVAAYLDPGTRNLVLEVCADTGHSDFAVRPGPRRDRGRPARGRPAGAVGPAAGGRDAEPGAAGGRRPRRAGRR